MKGKKLRVFLKRQRVLCENGRKSRPSGSPPEYRFLPRHDEGYLGRDPQSGDLISFGSFRRWEMKFFAAIDRCWYPKTSWADRARVHPAGRDEL